jgi:hypothetical protein
MKVLLAIIACCVSLFAQNQRDLHKKYGHPVSESFEVRPEVLATFTYDKKGSPCTLRIENKQSNVKFTETQYDFLTELIDELIPVESRGKNIINGFYSGVGTFGTFQDYEKLKLSRLIEQNKEISVFIFWKDKGCENYYRMNRVTTKTEEQPK